MTMMNRDDLDSNVVGIATFLFIIADLEQTVRNVTSSAVTYWIWSIHTNNKYGKVLLELKYIRLYGI